jgi:hypothetical protein
MGRRKKIEPLWVKLPRRWVSALSHSRSRNSYELALAILFESFRRYRYQEQEMSLCQLEMLNGMPRCSRIRAAEDLARLGLIFISKREGREAVGVTPIINLRKEREE